MGSKVEARGDKISTAIWLGVAILFSLGVFANYHYRSIALPLRIIGWIVLFSAMLGIGCLTSQGRRAVLFAREAKIELHKVVWPTRQETVQTTLMVVTMIAVMGLFLWAADSILLWLTAWLTGQRG